MERWDLAGLLAQSRTRWALALLLLGGWLLLWWQLAHGVFAIGPHRWDDFHYASNAILGRFESGIRNRYAHVWGLRAFYLLIDDRLGAAIAYAASIALGLTTLAFAFGRRAGGLPCGLLAAGLLPLFPPLLHYISAPMCDAPSALYAGGALLCALCFADGRRHPLWAIGAGLLCFASVKAKETGIAVVPAVVWLLTARDRPLRALMYLAGGALLGQAALCTVDLLITGDGLHSLRPRHYADYAEVIASEPAEYTSAKNRMKRGWLRMLLKADVRNFCLLALLGMALGYRRVRALAALTLWALGSLLFNAWVSYRYSGIDAQPRYLASLTLPVAVAGAYLCTQRWAAAPAVGLRDTAARAGADRRSWRGGFIYACGVLVACWLAYRGLRAGVAALESGRPSFPDRRAAFFLLPLVAPVFLYIAWTARQAWLRRAALPVVLAATVLLALPPAVRHARVGRREIAGWGALGDRIVKDNIRTIVRYKVGGKGLSRSLLRWRLRALSHADSVKQRNSGKLHLRPRELLLTTRSRQAKVEAAGYRTVERVKWGRSRFVVLERARR